MSTGRKNGSGNNTHAHTPGQRRNQPPPPPQRPPQPSPRTSAIAPTFLTLPPPSLLGLENSPCCPFVRRVNAGRNPTPTTRGDSSLTRTASAVACKYHSPAGSTSLTMLAALSEIEVGGGEGASIGMRSGEGVGWSGRGRREKSPIRAPWPAPLDHRRRFRGEGGSGSVPVAPVLASAASAEFDGKKR